MKNLRRSVLAAIVVLASCCGLLHATGGDAVLAVDAVDLQDVTGGRIPSIGPIASCTSLYYCDENPTTVFFRDTGCGIQTFDCSHFTACDEIMNPLSLLFVKLATCTSV